MKRGRNESGSASHLLDLIFSSSSGQIETKKWPRRGERGRLSYGPLHRLYESSKPLMIVIPNIHRHQLPSSAYATYHHLALQIAHDWYLYGGGDSMIVTDDHPIVAFEEIDLVTMGTEEIEEPFYRIYLGVGQDNQAMTQLLGLESNPVDIAIEKSSIQVGSRRFDGPGTGK